MKTSDLIEALKKLDPEGNAEVSTPQGAIFFIDIDKLNTSPYPHIDDENNYIVSNKQTNIIIHSMDLWVFVQENYDDDTTWDEIKKKIKFDLSYPTIDETSIKMASFLKRAKESFENMKRIKTEVNNMNTSGELMDSPSSVKKKKVGLLSKKINKK